VYDGLSCVLSGVVDGVNIWRCVENYSVYWYDDGTGYGTPTAGDGGGGGNDWGIPNSGPQATPPSDERVADCLERTFGIKVGPWKYTWGYNKDGANGSFSLTAMRLDSFTVSQVSASTNFSLDSRRLAGLYNSENSGPRYSMQSGYTSSNNRQVNWIASDVISNAVNGTFTSVGVAVNLPFLAPV
jgi:hypothetical protein